ncbi:MAG TPA: amidohydrolase [Jatrophihabitans sp.]|nr:amidohydrolase [Jatrophihabitans sp.]
MTNHADLAITSAIVRTADAGHGAITAVAIRDGRIAALGADAVRELIGPHTRVIEGGLVLPGFQDSHVHTPFAGRNRRNVELNGIAGRTAYLDAIAAFARARPGDEWIVGGGWAMEHFPGGKPVKEDLDAIVGDRPVFLFNRDVHGAWVSSAALRRAGIDENTPDPADGRIERDPRTGEPTGLLHEGAAYTFEATHVPRPSRAEWEAAILTGQQHLHSLGITGWQDAWVTPDTLDAYLALAADGRLTARVVGALWWDRHRGLEQITDFQAQRERGTGHRFFPTTVKIMVDGIVENQTGALLEPYCDGCGGRTDNYGLTYVDAQLLATAVTALDALDFQVHMHAIGDRAVRIALDAVEAAVAANGRRGNRHHIAHLQVVQPDDVPRFRELDVTANCQAYWAQNEPQMVDHTMPVLGDERSALQYPFGDLLRAGTRMAMGSDWGVTTADPLPQLEVAVTRRDPADRGGAPFLPEQSIPLSAAVTAFTAGSAWLNHDEADAGTITVGRRADLAVLDADILAPGAHPADATVRYTIASGEVVYEA